MYQSSRKCWGLIVCALLCIGGFTQVGNAQGEPCLEPCEAQEELWLIELGQCIVDQFEAYQAADAAYAQAQAEHRITLILL